jgi:cell division cycle 2-like protein
VISISRFLTYDPIKRISADAGLKHEFFNETPLPIDPSHFPTWPAKSEGASKNKNPQDSEPRAPSAAKAYEKLDAEEGFVLKAPAGFVLK